MKSQINITPVDFKPNFPALYRFIVPGPDFGVVYLVTEGENFDGVLVYVAKDFRSTVGQTARLGSPLSGLRWERLPSGSSVTLTQE